MKPILRNKDKGNFLERYVKSFCHALNGLCYAIKCEHNMIIILLAAIVATFLGFYYHVNSSEWLFIITIIFSVAASEMINTAVEAVVDLVTSDIKPLAKIAKDTASTATLLLSVAAFIGALVIFVPKIFI